MGLGHVRAGHGPGRGGQDPTTARGCSTARRPTRATCTRCCTGRPTSRRRSTCARSARAGRRVCFAMTEPEVAGSDPTLIQTRAYQDGDEWVINGHKWFISNAHRANFAILIARTEDDPDLPQAANTAFLVDIPSEGWTEVREVETMHGATGHSEIRIEDLRVPRRPDARRPGPGPPARPVPARPGPPRALHALDRPGRDGARHDGRPLAQPLRPRLAAGREAGHPVDDRRLDHGALPGQADGPARRLQDRPRATTSSPRSRWPSTSSPTR